MALLKDQIVKNTPSVAGNKRNITSPKDAHLAQIFIDTAHIKGSFVHFHRRWPPVDNEGAAEYLPHVLRPSLQGGDLTKHGFIQSESSDPSPPPHFFS